jgi:hypothetical protein
MKQGADLGDLVKRFVGQSRSFIDRRNRSLFFGIIDFLANNLSDLLPVELWLIREQHGGNGVTIGHRFFHHFSI